VIEIRKLIERLFRYNKIKIVNNHYLFELFENIDFLQLNVDINVMLLDNILHSIIVYLIDLILHHQLNQEMIHL